MEKTIVQNAYCAKCKTIFTSDYNFNRHCKSKKHLEIPRNHTGKIKEHIVKEHNSMYRYQSKTKEGKVIDIKIRWNKKRTKEEAHNKIKALVDAL
jgi:hypothetical protein